MNPNTSQASFELFLNLDLKEKAHYYHQASSEIDNTFDESFVIVSTSSQNYVGN